MPDVTVLVPVTYRPLTIGTGILSAAARTPDKIALVDGERRYSYRELADRMARLADAAYHRLGLVHGDHVAIVGPNSARSSRRSSGFRKPASPAPLSATG